MTTTITERDKKLLYFCGIAVFLFFFVRFLFLPALDSQQRAEDALQTAEEARTEMEMTIVQSPAAAMQVQQSGETLRSAVAAFYPALKSDALDDLITGIELNHNLTPLSLAISAPVPMAGGGDAGMADAFHWNDILAPLQPPAWDSAADAEYLCSAAVSFRAQGSRADFAALLDDLAANYPAIELRRFAISDSTTMNQQGETATTSTFDCVVNVYLCDKERELN